MIDWNFITSLEGKRYVGYVPDPKNSKSGVTIGVGVDVGHLTHAELDNLPQSLQTKLLPYHGLTGSLALAKLHDLPLMLDTDEVDHLDNLLFKSDEAELQDDYNRAEGRALWSSLPGEIQTVMMSVFWQYGPLAIKCPRFWKLCVAHDWHGLYQELLHFGDAYETRRKREAEYIKMIALPAV